MASFVNMFVLARYTCNDKNALRLFRAVSTVPRLQPFGAAAAVVQFADVNKVKFSHDYQPSMSLLVIHFTFLEGRDGELVVNEMAVVETHSNRVTSYVFKSPYSREEVPALNARMNQAIDHGCNWNDGWKLCYIARHHLPLQSIASGLRKQNLIVVSWTVHLLISIS